MVLIHSYERDIEKECPIMSFHAIYYHSQYIQPHSSIVLFPLLRSHHILLTLNLLLDSFLILNFFTSPTNFIQSIHPFVWNILLPTFSHLFDIFSLYFIIPFTNNVFFLTFTVCFSQLRCIWF